MRTVEWSNEAERQLQAWIDYLEGVAGPEVARRIYDEARAKAASLGRFSNYRQSRRWRECREVGLKNRKKLLVYQVEDGRVIIRALFDMRQDLDRVRP